MWKIAVDIWNANNRPASLFTDWNCQPYVIKSLLFLSVTNRNNKVIQESVKFFKTFDSNDIYIL